MAASNPLDLLDLRDDAAGRTPASGPEAWERLRQWVEAETGMDFSGSRLTRLLDAVKKVSAGPPPVSPLQWLRAGPEQRAPLLERLTAALTIGESFFFRNEHHFRALREGVIPDILRRRGTGREVRVWSAGCAGGEEPYSLAILFDQVLGAARDWHVSILATDLNPAFLEQARQACYRTWSFRNTDIHLAPTYFLPEGDRYRLVSRLRERVRFAYLNLVKDVYPSPLNGTVGLDLIVFRNVAIYLKPEVTRGILERFFRALRPGGWLLLGESEVTMAPPELFEVRQFEQATLHQRKQQPGEPLGDSAVLAPPPVLAAVSPAAASGLGPPAAGRRPIVPGRAGGSAGGEAVAAGGLPKPGLPAQRAAPNEDLPAAARIQRCLAEGHYEQAERALERLADKRVRAAARCQYARGLLACAELDRARRMLAVCLQEEPLLIDAQLLYASLAEDAGDYAAAEQAYRRALFVDRRCAMAHFQLALVQQRNGDWAGARRSLHTAMRIAATHDPQAAVEHGEGVCYGRLHEMAAVMLAMAGPPTRVGEERR